MLTNLGLSDPLKSEHPTNPRLRGSLKDPGEAEMRHKVQSSLAGIML